jgi:hypothetical protein
MKKTVSGQWSVATVIFLLTCHVFLVTAVAHDNVKESLSELNRILPSKKAAVVPWGRDPFVVLTVKKAEDTVALKLTAIIYNNRKPSAIVNNKIIYIGDSIEGQKVIDITKQYVILRGMGSTYKLGMEGAKGQSYDIKKTQQ